MSELPCLLFSESCEICDNVGFFKAFPAVGTFEEAKNHFFTSLSRSARMEFREFCTAAESDLDIVDRYKIFPLIGLTPFKYAFCEKSTIANTGVIVVFFAAHVSDFHALMSPSSQYYSTITGKLIHDVLSIEHSGIRNQISPETYVALSHIPCMFETLLSDENPRVMCSLPKIIEIILSNLKNEPLFCETQMKSSRKESASERDIHTFEFPVKPFIHTMTVCMTLLNTLSSDHVIDITTYSLAYAGEVELATQTTRIPEGIFEFSSLAALASQIPQQKNLAKIADIISYIFDEHLTVRYDIATERLKITIGLGFEKQTPPSFKYSNPYADAEKIIAETLRLPPIL